MSTQHPSEPQATIDLDEERKGVQRQRDLFWMRAAFDDPTWSGGSIVVNACGTGPTQQADVVLLPTSRTGSLVAPIAVWEVRPGARYGRPGWTTHYRPSDPDQVEFTTEHVSFDGALASALADASSDLVILISMGEPDEE